MYDETSVIAKKSDIAFLFVLAAYLSEVVWTGYERCKNV